jgi:hypothetical protein
VQFFLGSETNVLFFAGHLKSVDFWFAGFNLSLDLHSLKSSAAHSYVLGCHTDHCKISYRHVLIQVLLIFMLNNRPHFIRNCISHNRLGLSRNTPLKSSPFLLTRFYRWTCLPKSLFLFTGFGNSKFCRWISFSTSGKFFPIFNCLLLKV